SSKQEPNCQTKKWSSGHGKLTWIRKVSYVSNKKEYIILLLIMVKLRSGSPGLVTLVVHK
ncbi:MAG: hypothetical protein WAM19_03690, partial [Nitrososphaeraceae archaeon]